MQAWPSFECLLLKNLHMQVLFKHCYIVCHRLPNIYFILFSQRVGVDITVYKPLYRLPNTSHRLIFAAFHILVHTYFMV